MVPEPNVRSRPRFRKRLVAPCAGKFFYYIAHGNNTTNKTKTPYRFLSAGLEISIVWPSEYAKTQLQLNRGNESFNVFRHIRSEGFGIYRGLTPLLIGAPFQGLLRFGSLDTFNNLLRDPETGKVGRASGLLAGVSAGVRFHFYSSFEDPSLNHPHTPGTGEHSRRHTHGNRKDSIGGQWKGFGGWCEIRCLETWCRWSLQGLLPTMSKSCSNQALRFAIFNEYKRLVIGNRPTHELSASEALVGGMTAGCLGAVGNTPFDTEDSYTRTRSRSIQFHVELCCHHGTLYHSYIANVKEKLTNTKTNTGAYRGCALSWKGLAARCARVVPGQGILA